MNESYPIELAKTAFRDAYNRGDIPAVLDTFSEGLTNMIEGGPSYWGPEAKQALEVNLRETFAKYDAKLAVVIIDINLYGNVAFEHGWYKFRLQPKNGGSESYIKYRYCERWQKQPDGVWKIDFVMTNREHPPRMLPEHEAATRGLRPQYAS
jgi:ketosteroid isomerase-like protein